MVLSLTLDPWCDVASEHMSHNVPMDTKNDFILQDVISGAALFSLACTLPQSLTTLALPEEAACR